MLTVHPCRAVLGTALYYTLTQANKWDTEKQTSYSSFSISVDRIPSPVQAVEHSGVVEAAQAVWPEDMSHTIQKPPDEGVDASAFWGRLYVCLMVELRT